MITYNYNMTHEKVDKQGRDDHCELSHKTALHTVLLLNYVTLPVKILFIMKHCQIMKYVVMN